MNIQTLFFTLLIKTSLTNSKPDQNAKPLFILPLKTQEIPNRKLPFTHNITLTASLAAGTPPQNITMVLDTGSELSWLRCTNKTNPPPAFNPTLSQSYSPIPCTSPTCTTRTLDFSIPASCDSRNLCHAILSYADASSSSGNLALENFSVAGESLPAAVFGCMDSGFSTNSAEDLKSTGLLGMNRGSLSFVKQMGFGKFSYCISGDDDSGILLLGESSWNFTRLLDLNYTPLIQISNPLPYFDREAYTVRLEGIKVAGKWLPLPESVLEPDHTGAGQTMVDSGTQFTFLLGAAYAALRNEFVNRTAGVLRVLDEPDFVFQGAFDLCFRVALNATELPEELPAVSLVFRGAEITVSGERLLYRVAGEVRGGDSVRCLTFGNSDLAGIEAYIIGHYHQQNLWMEFDVENSRIGIGEVQCDVAGRRLGVYG